jgi:hypothetical protein
MIDNAPLGPIETQWGLGFRGYDECMDYIRAKRIEAPEGGLALPLRYTVYERSIYSVVPSNAIWRDPAHADLAAILRGSGELAQRRPQLYFPQVMRDARRIGEYYPGLSPTSPECMDRLGVSLAHLESGTQRPSRAFSSKTSYAISEVPSGIIKRLQLQITSHP